MPVKDEQLAGIFRALGDPNRLAIFEVIRRYCVDGGAQSSVDVRNSVSEIARQFDLSLSTVSHHLKELRTAGLIHCERRGQHILCSIDPEVLSLVERFAQDREA